MQQRSSLRSHDERVQIDSIGPARPHRDQPAVVVMEVDPVVAPTGAMVDDLELPPTQRMKRVGEPERAWRRGQKAGICWQCLSVARGEGSAHRAWGGG